MAWNVSWRIPSLLAGPLSIAPVVLPALCRPGSLQSGSAQLQRLLNAVYKRFVRLIESDSASIVMDRFMRLPERFRQQSCNSVMALGAGEIGFG